MPYISADRREKLAQTFLSELDNPVGGDLNYLFSMICGEYIEEKGTDDKPESYQTYQDCIGALECAKLELYVAHVRPYEETAIARNGDLPWVLRLKQRVLRSLGLTTS